MIEDAEKAGMIFPGKVRARLYGADAGNGQPADQYLAFT